MIFTKVSFEVTQSSESTSQVNTGKAEKPYTAAKQHSSRSSRLGEKRLDAFTWHHSPLVPTAGPYSSTD